MARITPIPTTRVSDTYATQRLLSQLQSDQLDLLKLQTQIATGFRIQSPSEDAPVALRAISLQKLLEQKAQVKTNLSTNQSFLNATDSAIAQVSDLINETRAAAFGVSSSTATNDQRESAAQQIDRAIQQLVDTANQTFRNRALFAGSRTDITPYTYDGKNIIYNGNEGDIQSFSDTDILFESNVPGSRIFGAYSGAIRGSADLNPNLLPTTKLADLNRGAGLKLGSILVSDGNQTSTIDLSNAHTLEDVKDIIEANPPLARALTVSITNNAIQISLDSSGGGNLFISDVGGGSTASDLGIANAVASGLTVTGRDLNPAVTKTTQLSELFGSRSFAKAASAGFDNDLVITAKTRGPNLNGFTVNYIDDGSVTAGGELVTFNAGTNTFTVNIDNGVTTANQVITALTNDAAFNANFTVALDSEFEENDGTGAIDLSSTGTTAGGTGTEFDQTSGLKINNGGQTYVIDFDTAETVEDLLNTLNGSDANILAQINATNDGIDIRSRLSGADFSIGENGGTTAARLGVKTLVGSTSLSELNHGLGVHTNPSDYDFKITRRDNRGLLFNIDNAKTVQEVIDLINNHVDNQDPASQVVASLDENGGGIKLVDNSTGIHNLKVEKFNNSQAAEDLGLVPIGQTVNSVTSADPTATLVGRDTNQQEAASIFTALLRSRDALRANDSVQLNRSFNLIDDANKTVSFTRADLGARQQALDTLQARIEDEEIELKSTLSNEIEVDPTQAISDLLSRQAAAQASLQLIGQISKLSLLDYL